MCVLTTQLRRYCFKIRLERPHSRRRITVCSLEFALEFSKNRKFGTAEAVISYFFSRPLQSYGADRDRTGDLLLAKQALSQLSYCPEMVARVKSLGPGGFEPPTPRLSSECSTPELRAQKNLCMNGHPELMYRYQIAPRLHLSSMAPTYIFREENNKGGDPAARSRTATLLRLHPNHQAQLGTSSIRGTSVASDFRGVTGGVYKARERIHRSLLICDY